MTDPYEWGEPGATTMRNPKGENLEMIWVSSKQITSRHKLLSHFFRDRRLLTSRSQQTLRVKKDINGCEGSAETQSASGHQEQPAVKCDDRTYTRTSL